MLTSLQADTRRNLQTLLQQYGTAVKQGGPGYNASIPYWRPAYKNSSIVAHNALGIQPHDLSKWIAAQGTVAGALVAHPNNLQSLVTDFNTTANAFARENVALANAVAELPAHAKRGDPGLERRQRRPAAGRNARAGTATGRLTPPVPRSTRACRSSTQLRLLVQPSELGGLASDLAATIPALADLTAESIPLMRNGVRPASSCLANVVHPWSQLTLNDPNFNASNGFPPRKVYVEAVDYLPGLAGESRTFDANGAYIRVLLTAGSLTYSLSPGSFGQAVAPLIATQPTLPPGGRRPPLQPNVPCETQPPISDLSSPTGPTLVPVK